MSPASYSAPTSPVAVVGSIAMLLAYLTAAWCVVAGIAGNIKKSKRLVMSSVYGLYAFTALIALSGAMIIYAFVSHDYTIKYVYEVSDTSMSFWYKVTAFWGGLDGSLLFWVLVLALFACVAIRVNHRRHRDMIGYVVATIMVVQLFFISLLVFTKDPFSTFLTNPPIDGKGLNPLLQNYWMVIHPPSLYTGFVAATIPFAFAIGALASGRLDDMWLGSVRSWMLICFFFLSFGLVLGGRWAYEVLGWGGYWAWDPVENAGLLPWFTATAFLHSIIIQEQRGMLKIWNLVLVIITFFLTIFGTFMTRSGIVKSVHAFGEDNVLALQFVLFMALVLTISIGLVVYRANKLRAANTFESFISREFAFLVNNWLLLGCAFFVLFATMFPTMTEALSGERATVGIEFFNKWMTPLALILLFLAGAAPLLAWRRTTRERLVQQFLVPTGAAFATILVLAVLSPASRVNTRIFADVIELPMPLVCFGLIAFTLASIGQEFYRGVAVRRRQTGSDPFTSMVGLVLAKRRKYGGYVVHLGIAVLFFGITGKAWDTMDDRTIELPAAELAAQKMPDTKAWFVLHGYRFRYDDMTVESDDNKTSITAHVELYDGNDKLADLYPRLDKYHNEEQTQVNVPEIRPRLDKDIYIVMEGFGGDNEKTANFRVYMNPLINWVWLGTVLLLIGTLICLIPASLVEFMSPRPKTRLGRMADAAILVIFVGAATFLAAKAAHAAPPEVPAAAEHQDVSSIPMGHNDGTGYAHLYRPESAQNPALAEKLMKDMVCMCGGCNRETLYSCKCGYAAQGREKVLELLAQGRDYDGVVAAFVAEYGGEDVLAEPRSKLAWALPYVAVLGGLALLFVIARGWVQRGQSKLATVNQGTAAEEDEYAERLDDELRDTD
ncbi:MAG TPA: cytochrome c-type biogenesis CcmF C-terminal domain-containing protein [Kofleriaceae bacterium]|jgi:cytochrome c-type biogenesis protein CcmF|nr:cytochrome c-type biogenesis CcmF C-terminal domain-containing protein [Kofleriaceae bacterium]